MKKKAFIRIVIALVGTVNAILTAKGINPIPFNETLVTEWISYAFDAAMIIWVWWKDAPITEAGIIGHDIMRAIKEDGSEIVYKIFSREDEE
jgi:SPP1 family holin